MFYVFLLILGALGLGIYLIVFLGNVPGAAEERLGVLEPLPPDVGKWRDDLDSPAGKSASEEGLTREERMFFDEASGRLLHQVRYRARDSEQIVRADPDRVVKRKRLRR